MKRKSSELFLLIGDLSNKNDKSQIIDLFIVGLNSIYKEWKFKLSNNDSKKNLIQISTPRNTFGYISCLTEKNNLNNDISIIKDAAKLLAIILEKNDKEEHLKLEKDKYEKLYIDKAKKEILQSNILENISDSIVGIDMDYIITSWNKASENVYGWLEEEVIGKSFRSLVKPEYINISRDEVLRKLNTTGSFKGEVYHYHKDGSKLTILVSVSFMTNLEGARTGLIAVNINITDHKEAEIALVNSEARQKEMISNISDVISIISREGKIIYSSPNIKELFGWVPEEVIGKSVFLTVHKSDIEKIKESFESLIQKYNSTVTIEYKYKAKDGKYRFVHCRAKNLINNEQIKGILLNYHDISHRKEAEKHLIESESRFKALHNASFGGIAIHDKGVILDCNHGLSIISGYAQNELIGMDGLLLISETSRDIVLSHIISLHEEPYEAIGLKKDGSEYPLRLEGKQIPFKGNTVRVVEFRDITERKLIENNLSTVLKKANESDRLKSAFLATMSHELRTPLNAIIGFSDILKDSLTDENDQGYADIIFTSGQHLLSIVDDLFDIALIESGETKVSETDFDINEIINDVYQIITIEKRRVKKDQLLINTIIPYSNGLFVKSDKLKLKQVLINLLRNAIKFTDNGIVEFGYDVVESNNETTIEFFVKDSGIGISEKMQKIIFDIFKQVDDSHTRQFGGTGIGLSIAKKLTELLGGNIWVNSEIGVGSDFRFNIPHVAVSNTVISSESDELLSNNGKVKGSLVLIAEDDYDSYFFLDIILKENSIKTLWADNGKSAIEYCRDNPDIDMVLMDINLPIMNGYEATIEIKQFRPELPIIAQTAYAISGDKEKAIEIGCDDYISKPIKRDNLMKLISNHINKLK